MTRNAPGEQPLLAVRDLTKSYGGAFALEAVSLEFGPGEVHALLGENGAGKSTLVKAIAGVVMYDSGEITGSAHESGDVAMVFQELSVVPEMSIFDNLALSSRGRRGLTVSYSRLRERAKDSLASAGLGSVDLSSPAEILSLAQRQLLEIARGLMADARVLILDEPTATLSDVEIARVHDVIRRLSASGTSVVYITHRLGEVFALSDRVTIMRSGRVVASAPTADLDMRTVVTHMLGSEHVPAEKEVPGAAVPAGSAALSISNLSVEGLFAEVSLTVDPGQVAALFGQIGSGADGVARAVAGLVDRTGGVVRLGESELRLSDRAVAQREGVAYISPDRVHEGVFLEATVTRNISSGALPRVSSAGVVLGRREERLARETSVRVALDPRRIDEPVSAFSGGNQQKVAVARALATEPTILVLNEPTRGVDIGARSEIYRSIRELAAQGVIVLVYSSDVLEIRELADRVTTLYRGRVVGDHVVDDVADSVLLTEILNGAAA